jgi:hypothetical protein
VVGERLKIVLSNLRKFECHQVMIAHQMVVQTKLLKDIRYQPAMTEKLADLLPGKYDLFLRIRKRAEKGGMTYEVLTQSGEDDGVRYEAGCRLGGLSDIEAPDMSELIRRVGGYIP